VTNYSWWNPDCKIKEREKVTDRLGDVFYRTAFNNRGIVVLIFGVHVYEDTMRRNRATSGLEDDFAEYNTD